MFFTIFLKDKIWYIVFVLAVAYFLLLIRTDLVQNKALRSDKAAMSMNIVSEKNELAFLKGKMGDLKKNHYLEQIARDKLGMIERGESAYKVIIKE